MHRVLLASIAAVGFCSGAFAADMPLYTKAPPGPVPYSWTGFYGGVNIGGVWGNNDPVTTVSSPVQGFADGIGPASFAAHSAAGATGSVDAGNKASFIGGGQIGYDWQFAPTWVAGLETDIQGVANNGGNNGTIGTTVGPFPFFGAAEVIKTQITSSNSLDYLGTFRGRLGYLATPTVLLYGTGGLAYGGVKASTLISQSNNDCVAFPGNCIQPSAATAGSISQTRTGWMAGAGLEWMFWQHWSAKFEYLHYDLGSVTFNDAPLVVGRGSFAGAGGSAVIGSQSTTSFSGNIVRAGVNYHF